MGTRQSIRIDSTTRLQLTARECCLWLLGQRHRFCVSGHSMEPLLYDGEEILVVPYEHRQHCHVGDIVICEHPRSEHTHVVKRVQQINAASECVLLEGKDGNDAHRVGWVDMRRIVGVVTAVFRKNG